MLLRHESSMDHARPGPPATEPTRRTVDSLSRMSAGAKLGVRTTVVRDDTQQEFTWVESA
jgi:hypothetical protein